MTQIDFLGLYEMRNNTKQAQPSKNLKKKENHYDLTVGSSELITNISENKSPKIMFDLKSRSDGFVRRLEGREVGLQPWSLNRRIVEESMLAYTTRVHNLSNKQHTRHSHQSADHRDRLAVQALMQRARGHNRWAPLPKIDRKPDANLALKIFHSSGIIKESTEDDKRASSDICVKVLYNSDWGTESPIYYPQRPSSEALGAIIPVVNAYHPPIKQAFIDNDRRFAIDLQTHSEDGLRSDRGELESEDSQPSDSTRSPDMSSYHVGHRNCAVEIVAFPEIPLQATPAVLHINPKSTQKHHSTRKIKNDAKKQGYQFVHRSKLPPLPKIEGVRKRPPFIRKDQLHKGTNQSLSPSPDKDENLKAVPKLSFKLSQTGKDKSGSLPSPDERLMENVNGVTNAESNMRETGLISVTVRKRMKGSNKDGAEGVNSITNTCALPLEESDLNSQTSVSLPTSENTNSSGIRSVLRKGEKKSGKSVQFGDELEFVRMVTKIEYPWYNEVTSSEDDEPEQVESDDHSESVSSENESSDNQVDCEHENGSKGGNSER